MEMSQSEQESVDARSRGVSFNAECLNARLQQHEHILESPQKGAGWHSKFKSVPRDDMMQALRPSVPLDSNEARNRLFSGHDADVGNCNQPRPEVSESGFSQDSYVITNQKIAK
jgi:hypothetical protein